jgi:N6-L-threonylcarbamoyladenine synthase
MLWQISIHFQYGGVVPELASARISKEYVPVIDAALRKANINEEQLSAIAFTPRSRINGFASCR